MEKTAIRKNTIKFIHSKFEDYVSNIDDKSIDLICSDLHYGTGRHNWLSIDPNFLWEQYERIMKPTGVVVLFGQGMFSAKLMLSNENMWRYNLIWKKGTKSTNFLNANRMPLRNHEDLLIFYKKQRKGEKPTYNPQKVKGAKPHTVGKALGTTENANNNYGHFKKINSGTDMKHPRSILQIDYLDKELELLKEDWERCINDSVLDFHPPVIAKHPTQKPVDLLKWVIGAYSNEGDLVHDSTYGSGTTGIACHETGRNFIGTEHIKENVDIANERLSESTPKFW